MRVVIANDHGGYELKRHLLSYFEARGIEVVNLGTNSNESVDYPVYGELLAREVLKGEYDFGIAICGTGIGISMAVNKFQGIRAALIYDLNTAMLAKEHNNANIIVLGGRTLTNKKAEELIEAFMNSKFEERHQHRLDLLGKLGEK
ncbi:MAG TPA: ribose 5-phosphate isomerase B [Acholeplasmataceae bacterium]|jgi:ribose 5-phosphate isomerase B|nr:ribose 5-phosphate isomerase B [Acholeplasmataceae bacterium]HPX72170.1 ribose 5-phosphate isomerase B [Acholeplasmataceae bacterium]